MPAGPPEPVHGCVAHDASSTRLTVNCSAGYDGGLRQSFQLEVFDYKTETLIHNDSNSEPNFVVHGLVADSCVSLL